MAHALGRHLALIGFMGAGKTTVGKEVAARLGRPFLDFDEAIEAEHGAIWDLFAREGEAAFREIEARFVHDACGHATHEVGTCAVCGEPLGRDVHVVPGPGSRDPSFVGQGRPVGD